MMKMLGVILCGIFLISCEQNFPVTEVDDNRGKPLVDIHNQPWRFADYKGKWIVVNYWASWCKPCITEVPELEAFYQAHKNTDAIVVGVNYDFVSLEETAKLAEHYSMTYPVLPSEPDPYVQMGTEPIMVLPTTLIINPQGQVVAKLIGEQSQQTLEKVIAP
jgi:thiol-disulfide isomerase/thioredoxin